MFTKNAKNFWRKLLFQTKTFSSLESCPRLSGRVPVSLFSDISKHSQDDSFPRFDGIEPARALPRSSSTSRLVRLYNHSDVVRLLWLSLRTFSLVQLPTVLGIGPFKWLQVVSSVIKSFNGNSSLGKEEPRLLKIDQDTEGWKCWQLNLAYNLESHCR